MEFEPEQDAWDTFDSGLDEQEAVPKVEVECICPMCRQRYKLKMRWIGRGAPRKYCTSCRPAGKRSV